MKDKIRKKAIELGYDDCGIIDVSSMQGYGEKLAERLEMFPDSGNSLKNLGGFASPAQKYS